MNPNPKQYLAALKLANNAKRCGAKTRKGTPCMCPAMQNGRCYKHGGKVVKQMGEDNGRYIDGRYSKDTKEYRQEINAILKLNNCS